MVATIVDSNFIHLGEARLGIYLDLYHMRYKKSINLLFGIFISLVFLNSLSAQNDREILSTTFTMELAIGPKGNIQVSHLSSEISNFPDGSMIKITTPKHLQLEQGCTVKGLFKFNEFASAGGLGSTRVKGVAKGKGVLQSLTVVDQEGQAITCPPFCEKSLALELQIANGDLGSGR